MCGIYFIYFSFLVTQTYGEENKEDLRHASQLDGHSSFETNARLPYILNNLPPYTGPPSHSVIRKSKDYMTPAEKSFILMSSSTSTSTTSTTLPPYIDPTTPTNVTVIKGKTAMLVCVVKDLGTAKVTQIILKSMKDLLFSHF